MDEFESKIAQDLKKLVDMGLVDFTVNEDGEFVFKLIQMGEDVYTLEMQMRNLEAQLQEKPDES